MVRVELSGQGFEEAPDEGGDRGIQLGGADTRAAVCLVGDGYRDVFHDLAI